MFDTRKTGAKIMSLRKAKDMTQMELADLMQVSYQAVSNWERGNSMPDISKLADLARVLDVTIEDLLDSRGQAQAVYRVMHEDEDLTIKEIAEVAPILKPSKIEENVEKANLHGLNLDDLMMIAPFLDNEDMLGELLQHVELSSIEDLVPFAPFLNEKQLVAFIDQQDDFEGRLETITHLAPFLDERGLCRYAKKLISEDESIESIVGLAPFLDGDCLMSLVEKIGPTTISEIAPLAPFIDSEDLVRLVKKIGNS